MLAIPIHIAQKLGIHNEATLPANIFEAEMCRRLWWSLVTFNHRICEVSEYRTTLLLPTWDCKRPRNLQDADFRPDMQTPPPTNDPSYRKKQSEESLFTHIRYLAADSTRHSSYHLNFISKNFSNLKRGNDEDLNTLSSTIESYLQNSPSNPLQYLTTWMSRAQLARSRLLEYYSRHRHLASRGPQIPIQNPSPPTTTHYESSIPFALHMLQYDTLLRTSPLAKPYLWFLDLHLPMIAYIHTLRYLRTRPKGPHAGEAWRYLSENFAARCTRPKSADAVFEATAKLVMLAWQVNQELRPVPRIVVEVRRRVLLEREKRG